MRLRDADGDIWEEDSEGGWYLIIARDGTKILDEEVNWLSDRETLDIIWGPLSEVDE